MRAVVLSSLFLAVACGPSDRPSHGLCDEGADPRPEACAQACDPLAANLCPDGFHCFPDGTCDQNCRQGLGDCGDGERCTNDGHCVPETQCTGLECDVVECGATGGAPTTLTGQVFAPNGTMPLYGVNVYVPNEPLPAEVEGAVCDRCSAPLPGAPLTKVKTDANGMFTLANVPAGVPFQLVVTTGKWRRVVDMPAVAQCETTAVEPELTRLPRNTSEGDMPRIAITTGAYDALECLVRRLGIDDTEFGVAGSAARIHLFAGGGDINRAPISQFGAGFAGGSGAFPSATPFWADLDQLKQYDIVMMSCEGTQNANTKPQGALNAMKLYADLGGRAFMTHWHNIWIEGATLPGGNGQKPAVWTDVAQWDDVGTVFTTPPDTIDEINNPKGTAFADWMLGVMGSPAGQRGVIPLQTDTGRQTVTGLTDGRAERWVYWNNLGHEYPQMFQFTTPNEAPANDRCGKVVFSDMHVSDGPVANTTTFPESCGTTTELSPQEKALAFMFFDVASCVDDVIL